MNALKALHAEQDQAVWLDFVARGFIEKGELKKLVEEDGLRGVTSNPAIFEKAIGHSDEYDASLKAVQENGDSRVIDLYEGLAIADIQAAADVLRPVYEASDGADGYVSLEVSPYLALDTQATLDEARRLHKAVARDNLMVKVPATPEGIPAIKQLTAEGISINVTLLFSQEAYEAVARAFVAGLEERAKEGHDVSRIASVASFFISRIDSLVDKMLDEKIAAANDPDEKIALGSLKGRWRSPTPSSPTSATSASSPRRNGRLWPRRARRRSVCSGPPRDQEQGLFRRALRRGADRPEHRQHHAPRDHGRLPRPRRGPRDH